MLTSSREITMGVNDMGLECTSCHTIRGVGEVLAPDLTEFGEKTEHEFEQTHVMKWVAGKKSKYTWTYQHFLDPQKITPGDAKIGMEPTIMPVFGFTPEQAHTMTVFTLSMRQNKMPAKYMYNKKPVSEKASFISDFEKTFQNYDQLPVGERLFIKSNCWFCHSIDNKGGKISKNLTHIGGKMTKETIKELLTSPSKMGRHELGTKLNFTEEQIDALTGYLASLK
jgi:cytochrome c2